MRRAQLGGPAGISSDLRGPFVGRESNKLPAYGAGQEKMIKKTLKKKKIRRTLRF